MNAQVPGSLLPVILIRGIQEMSMDGGRNENKCQYINMEINKAFKG
jgi:hypothetical protein